MTWLQNASLRLYTLIACGLAIGFFAAYNRELQTGLPPKLGWKLWWTTRLGIAPLLGAGVGYGVNIMGLPIQSSFFIAGMVALNAWEVLELASVKFLSVGQKIRPVVEASKSEEHFTRVPGGGETGSAQIVHADDYRQQPYRELGRELKRKRLPKDKRIEELLRQLDELRKDDSDDD